MAADAGIEDAIPLVVCDAFAVVFDCVDDVRALTPDRDADAGRSVSACVLEHRLQDPLGQVGVDPDTERPPGLADSKLQVPLGGQTATGARSAFDDGVGVRGTAFCARFVTGRCDECVDRPRELVGVPLDQPECAPVLVRLAIAAKSELRFGAYAGERRTELV